jgi:hypothetical protein
MWPRPESSPSRRAQRLRSLSTKLFMMEFHRRLCSLQPIFRTRGRILWPRTSCFHCAMDQICRDWCSSVFVYAVSAARQAVMTVLVHGEDIHDHGFPTREQCALMTGFQGDEGGPWSTTNSQTIVPGGSGSSSTPKKLWHASKIHAVQSHFLGALTQGVVFFDPGDRLCCHASAPTCIACAH